METINTVILYVVYVCVSSQSKTGFDFGDRTTRNITASNGKLHLIRCECICMYTFRYRVEHSVYLSSLNGDLNAKWGRDRWYLSSDTPRCVKVIVNCTLKQGSYTVLICLVYAQTHTHTCTLTHTYSSPSVFSESALRAEVEISVKK